MEYKFNFKTEEEKEQIIKNNSNLTLIKISVLLNESYLVFTDEEIIYELTENEILGNKISILVENQKSILRGDMRALAMNLYPEDFVKQ